MIVAIQVIKFGYDLLIEFESLFDDFLACPLFPFEILRDFRQAPRDNTPYYGRNQRDNDFYDLQTIPWGTRHDTTMINA